MDMANISDQVSDDDSRPDEILESITESIVATPFNGETVENFALPVIRENMDVAPTDHFESDIASSTVSSSFNGVVPMEIDWLAIVKAKEDDLDDEMMEIFNQEGDERFDEIDKSIAFLVINVGDKKQALLLKRAVHTLKGSANTTGARKIGALFHHLEDLMESSNYLTDILVATVQVGSDAAFAAFKAMKEGKSIDHAVERSLRRTKSAGYSIETSTNIPESKGVSDVSNSTPTQLNGDTETIASVTMSNSPSTANTVTDEDVQNNAKQRVKANAKSDKNADANSLRVSKLVMDTMVKAVGEVGITRSRVGLNIDTCKSSLAGLGVSMTRLSGLLRQIELEAEKQMFTGNSQVSKSEGFDALQMDKFSKLQELTRRVAEAQNDLMIQQATTVYSLRDMEDAVAAQYVLINGLSSNLDQIRQVRVSSIVPLLKRVVRAACRDTGKQGEIFFDADVEIDRGILDRTGDAFEHILRNAIAHGIETPEEREQQGKDRVGTIEFRAYQDGGDVVIEIRDDGNGIDTTRVFNRAVERGLIMKDAQLSDDEIRDLLFEPGFSTAESVSDIAGRGVGLDVVRSDISSMGGRVQIQSAIGKGTTFVLRVPATLTVISGSAVKTNGHMYIVPVAFIDRLIRVSSEDLELAYKSRKLVIEGNDGKKVEYEFWGMWEIVGLDANDSRPTARNSIILMNGDRVAVHVDEIRPADDFVFRPMGPQISISTGLIGSTISASGHASVVIDTARVARILRASRKTNTSKAKIVRKLAPMVLVVDDSLTVRTVASRFLKKNGYRVKMAIDGMQALERINEEKPDAILLDIEMPVMNGYEALQSIRATPATASLPVIMITSRVGESHRKKAFDLGVNAYLGKPYNEAELLGLIQTAVGAGEVVDEQVK